MRKIFDISTYGFISNLMILMIAALSLNCTSSYIGPLRFTNNNQSERACPVNTVSENNSVSVEPNFPRNNNVAIKKYLIDNSQYDSTGQKTYLLKTTSNNLRYVVEIPEVKKPAREIMTADICCLEEIFGTDTAFCRDFISTFFDLSNILVQLSNIHPIIRVCLIIGLKYFKPLFYRLCYQKDCEKIYRLVFSKS